MDIRRLVFEIEEQTLQKLEFVAQIREMGDEYIVSTIGTDGWYSFHPPYIVNKEGKILGLMERDKTAQDIFEKARLIYDNPPIEIKD